LHQKKNKKYVYRPLKGATFTFTDPTKKIKNISENSTESFINKNTLNSQKSNPNFKIISKKNTNPILKENLDKIITKPIKNKNLSKNFLEKQEKFSIKK